MKHEITSILLALSLSLASPVPHYSHNIREVPQEHSHNHFLDLVRTSLATNNPQNIKDPVFGLLGNAAAAAGAGSVVNLDCLQQETADQAFSNAMAAGDTVGMAGALVYRALERNTGSVGLASVLCNETAVNPQIAALTQHQDPTSPGAASINKGVAIALAQQLAGIGADPLLALESGTFAPGTIGDPTAAGHTCDTENDEPGCVYSQKLLVLDATEDEISSAVAGIKQTITGTGVISATDINLAGLPVASATGAVAVANATVATTTTTAAGDVCGKDVAAATTAAAPASSCTIITTTVAANAASSMMATLTSSATVQTGVAAGTNVQTFTGTLGGPPPPVVSSSGDRPFSVQGNTFVNAGAALQRSCSIQHNACANAANSGALSGGVGQCDTQEAACNAADRVSKRAAALDFGSCSAPAILFEAGLDGRNTNAFIAQDQTDYNHGSALNIGVIAGFICQRLGSPCNAPAAVQSSCTSASAAAVATTQNQAAADVFNSILGVGAGNAGSSTAVATTAAMTAAVTAGATMAMASAVVMTITSCA